MIDRPGILHWCDSIEQAIAYQDRPPTDFLTQALQYLRALSAEVDPRQPLLEEAALVLEQEGWLLGRMQHEGRGGGRINQFADRHKQWLEKIKAFRVQNPNTWPEPPDNS